MRTYVKKFTLDEALAAGGDPTGSDELTLRAEQLGAQKSREQLAESVERMMRARVVGASAPLFPATVPVVRAQVESSRAELRELVECLRDDGPHNLRGLAMANLLVENGAGPLYNPKAGDDLKHIVQMTLSALHPWPRFP